MLVNNAVEKYQFRDGNPPWCGVYDSHHNLWLPSGTRPNPVPSIELKVQATRTLQARATFPQPVDTITLYYLRTNQGISTLAVPNPWEIEMAMGLECLEEPLAGGLSAAKVTPASQNDGGWVMTWSGPQLVRSVALYGRTVSATPTDPTQTIVFRILATRFGDCCTPTVNYGPTAAKA